MEVKQFIATNLSGDVIPGASVSVFATGGALASVYDPAGSPLSNPFASDATGFFQFAAPDGGGYSLVMSGGGVTRTLSNLQFFDITANAAQITANTASAAASAASALLSAQASGVAAIYNTKADANAALAGLANLAIVEVLADESVTGSPRTRYRKESGAYVFKINFDALKTLLFGPTGSTQVGFGTRQVSDKLREVVSVLDSGGAGNWNGTTGSDNRSAGNTAYTNNGAVRLHFPFISGALNAYYFSSGTFAGIGQMEIDADAGVKFYFADGSALYNPEMNQVKVTRPIKCHQIDINYDFTISSVSKSVFLNQVDADKNIATSVSCTDTNELQRLKVNYTGGLDAFSADTAATAPSASVLQFANAPNDGFFHLGMRNCAPGDLLPVNFVKTAGGSYLGVILVRSLNAYQGLIFDTTDAASGVVSFVKTTGSGNVTGTPSWPGKGTHASYSPYKSRIAIRINSYNAFDVMLNGSVIASFVTAQAVYQAGFGVLGNAASAAATVQIRNMVVIRGRDLGGLALNHTLVLGDSKTADRVNSWPYYYRQAMEGFRGARVVHVSNYAIAGQIAYQQYLNLQTLGVPTTPFPPTVCLIDLGTNDGQFQTNSGDASGFVGVVASIVALVRATNPSCTFVVADFSLWYSQALNGGNGQAGLAYDLCSDYRGQLVRYCADNGIKMVDLSQVLGPIINNFSSVAGASPYYSEVRDRTIDDIHPSDEAAQLIGIAFARAVADALAREPSLVASGLAIDPTAYLGGWTQFAGQPLEIRVDASGDAVLDGVAIVGGAGSGTSMFTIPANRLPVIGKTVRAKMPLDNGNDALFAIDSVTGIATLQVTLVGTPTYLYVNNLRWKIGNGRT